VGSSWARWGAIGRSGCRCGRGAGRPSLVSVRRTVCVDRRGAADAVAAGAVAAVGLPRRTGAGIRRQAAASCVHFHEERAPVLRFEGFDGFDGFEGFEGVEKWRAEQVRGRLLLVETRGDRKLEVVTAGEALMRGQDSGGRRSRLPRVLGDHLPRVLGDHLPRVLGDDGRRVARGPVR
jgi:hypothetical protein